MGRWRQKIIRQNFRRRNHHEHREKELDQHPQDHQEGQYCWSSSRRFRGPEGNRLQPERFEAEEHEEPEIPSIEEPKIPSIEESKIPSIEESKIPSTEESKAGQRQVR
jgi:hypothetical protein